MQVSTNPLFMKKYYSLFILGFYLCAKLIAQDVYNSSLCTPSILGNENLKISKRIVDRKSSAELVDEFIPLKFHIVRNGPVAFDDTTHVADLLLLMNETFLDANIQFEKCGGINFIENSQMSDGFDPTTIKNQLHDTHGQANVINVYIANTTVSFGGFSFAGPLNDSEHFIQDNAVVMNGTQYLDYDTFLLAHELGHYFGLYHPSVTTYGFELVDGSNCEVAGDFCCDTPAARAGMCCRVNCDFVASPEVIYDSQGDSINPDIKNIMSVMAFTLSCREYFTPDQYERMAYYHENFLQGMSCSGGLGIDDLQQSTFDVIVLQDANSQSLSFELKDFDGAFWNLQLYDITGMLVYEENHIEQASHQLTSNRLERGVYIFVFELDGVVKQMKYMLN